jgi:hypothetical protein
VGIFGRSKLVEPVPLTPEQWAALSDDRVGLLFSKLPVPRDHRFEPGERGSAAWQAHSLVASAGRLQYRCEARGRDCDASKTYRGLGTDEVALVQRAWDALGRSREVASSMRGDSLVRSQFDAVLSLAESLRPLVKRMREAGELLEELAGLESSHEALERTRGSLASELSDCVTSLEATASSLGAHALGERRARALERAAALSSDAHVLEALTELRSALEGQRAVLELKDRSVSARADELEALL